MSIDILDFPVACVINKRGTVKSICCENVIKMKSLLLYQDSPSDMNEKSKDDRRDWPLVFFKVIVNV